LIGQTVSHYKILEQLGEGGMGVVYKAEDTKLKRITALKFISPNVLKDGAEKARFINEAQTAAGLNHPNIVTIYEINEHEGQTYIAMEYVAGRTLKERMAAGDRLPTTKIIEIADQICRGLQEAHKNGIVHRDVKPANIIIAEDGRVKILDFGLAKLRGQADLTRAGTTLGTVTYMSPEQALAKEVDPRSDLWSLGVILYEMLAGHPPFQGDYEQAMIYAIINEAHLRLDRHRLDPGLVSLVDRLLAKSPRDRPVDAAAVLDELKSVRTSAETGGDVKTGEDMSAVGERSRGRRIAAAVITVVAVSVALFWFLRNAPVPPTPPAEKESPPGWEKSIAVLPFSDLSPQRNQEYFCDGMTEDIITKLSKIRELKVISRTSVMRYKNTQKDIKAIGEELGVATILEGSIRREADNIRVSAQLINISDGFHLWADTYDRKLSSVFEVQDDVSKSIARALQIEFTPDQFKLDLPDTVEAYDYFQEGRHWINSYLISRRVEDYDRGLEILEKALELSPNNARIYSILVWIQNSRASLTGEQIYRDMAIENSRKAFCINPDLSETNTAIAWVYQLEGKHEKTALHLRKALDIDDNMSEINHSTGYLLYEVGLYHKAIPYFHKAEALNPFYLYTPLNLGRSYLNVGDLARAEVFFKKAITLAPKDIFSHCGYVEVLIRTNRLSKAESLLASAISLQPDNPHVRAVRAFLLALRGKKEDALSQPITDDWYLAQIYGLLGMNDEAFKLLEAGSEPAYLRFRSNSFYDKLRGDARYQSLHAKLKQRYEHLKAVFADL
jgi:non-specific serine/threonine protein kinase